MKLDLKESQELFDWLMQRGLTLSESAYVLTCISCGDSLGLAFMKLFDHKEKNMERLYDKTSNSDWGNPLTP